MDRQFTDHGETRRSEREVPPEVVELTREYGTFEIDGKPDRFRVRVDRTAVTRCPALRRWRGLVVVVSKLAPLVITLLWDRPWRAFR